MNFAIFSRLSPSRQQWLHRAGAFVLGLLLLWLLAWLAVPPILKSQVQRLLGEQLGRAVSIGQIDFKPWTLELDVQDLAIAHATTVTDRPASAGDPVVTPQVHIKRLYADLELQSLLRLAPVVDALTLESPQLQLRHLGQGRYDVDDVLARLASRPANPDAAPLRFALYNLVLQDGGLDFTDDAQGKVHRLSGLKISLPFLSNLDALRDVQVQPLLAFDLNGSRFDSTAHTTPFAQTRKTEAQFSLKRLDLAPYLGYWPASLPARLTSAVIDADLKLVFEQAQQPQVAISGLLSASSVKLQATGKGSAALAVPELLAFDKLALQFKSLRPLERVAQLSRVDWQQPLLTLHRNKQGQVNWLALAKAQQTPSNASKTVASSADRARATGQKQAETRASATSTGWQLGIDQIALEGGEVRWLDDAAAAPVRLALTELSLQAQALTWPFTQPMPFQGAGRLNAATLTFKGDATDQAADVSVSLAELPLSLAAPYLAGQFIPTLDGMLTTELALNWKAASATDAGAQILLKVPSLTLDKLLLSDPRKARLASIKQVRLETAELDVARQTVTLARLRLEQPQGHLARDAQGRWNFEDWRKDQLAAQASTPAVQPAKGTVKTTTKTTAAAAAPVPAAVAPVAAGAPADAARPWLVTVQDFALSDASLGFQDMAHGKAVALDLSALSLQLKNFSSAAGKPFGLTLAARVRHGNTEPGQLSWRGNGSVSPLSLQGDVLAQRLPAHALVAYVGDSLNVAPLRLDASFKGKLDLAQQSAGLALQVRGDARLEDVLVHSLAATQGATATQPANAPAPTAPAQSAAPAEELLRWKSLNLNGLTVALKPGSAPRVEVSSTVLSDFYARLILSETGRLSLQDVMKPAAATDAAGAPPASAAASSQLAIQSIASSAIPASATGQNDAQNALAPQIRFGPISLVAGQVHFTDRFIKPNYSANLTELTGRLGAFSSQASDGQVQLADLDLRGRVEGSATLEVQGKVNPLAKPLALDIKGRVRDLELAPLSPYAVRYAGYGIERGKLSVDIAYLVQPDGMLTASNNIVLNQLKFGDKVPDATASLPVKLAVALLADRNGVIDLNLPVSGSLNDPQFRLLPIVFKIVGNLIAKAITAPFSLLAGALGGAGDEANAVPFAAGSSTLTAQARSGLDKIAKALADRPALKMTVVGSASLEQEREAFKRAQLQNLLLAEKRRADKGAPAEPTASDPVVPQQEYPALLKAVYKRADFAKPRNLVGLAKDLPAAEMEALLLANLTATEADMAALALKRAVVVRDYLASQKLPADRLSLGAAKAVTPDAKWQPRADLNLTLE